MFKKLAEDEVFKKLTEYAFELGKHAYLVGGVVRDTLLKQIKKCKLLDFDIATSLTLNELKAFAVKNNLKFDIKNKKLEVIAIYGDNNIVYEIARLRKEKYLTGCSHVPSKVSFTESVEDDAKRRDFTINSMYYDRHSNSIIDPFGGMKDLENGLVRTVLDADNTLSVDPARIIRLVELAARFNLKVEGKTLNSAKKYAGNVFNLNKDRLYKELDRLKVKNKYGEDYNDYIKRVHDLLVNLGLDLLINTEN